MQIKWPQASEETALKEKESTSRAAESLCLAINGLSFSYSEQTDVKVLDDVSLKIYENEFFTLLGPSGCGKTTLLRLIAGFQQQTAGEILLGNHSLTNKPPFQRPINTVFQNYALFPHMTVAQNVAFGLEMKKFSAETIKTTVSHMLSLTQLENEAHRYPRELSGGQQQRVALARALASRPKLLLLDEPLSALDLKLRKEMQRELKRLQHETGTTFLFVTHNQDEALSMSDRIGVMIDGQIQQIGTPEEIYNRPFNRCVAEFIGDINFLEGVAERNSIILTGGQSLPIQSDNDGFITLSFRPEHAKLNRHSGLLFGHLKDITYFGTSTIYYVDCEGQPLVQVRSQNKAEEYTPFTIGEGIYVQIPQHAFRVLAS
ncbi:ABC transporter ATP-binding protein [Mycoavidus sp. B2-EB]|uniref:ABC transporter ATP-binding protein n=1 Tax=Mycoavidus sp. B2-EB TaxID=2651972 RepID=UPI0016253403|nr:ABC transporter ATP-binding protein [Mycoavidus sp. B2-EB]BBO59821.1 polyamine-transporting ATPase [Mycoavidus sp. B2-EB]